MPLRRESITFQYGDAGNCGEPRSVSPSLGQQSATNLRSRMFCAVARGSLSVLMALLLACSRDLPESPGQEVQDTPDSVLGDSQSTGRKAAGPDSLTFSVLRTLGPEASSSPIGEAARRAPRRDARPLLNNPRMAVLGPDGRYYVLDTGNRQIFVYDSSAQPVGAIGAYGEGPGEMAGPLGLDITRDGRIAVVDMQLRRVTVFDTTGRTVQMASVNRNGAAIVLHDSAFDILTDFGPSSPGVGQRYSLDGSLLKDLLQPDARDREFSRGGVVGWLARGPFDGELLYLGGAPGRLTVLARDGSIRTRATRELFPEAGFRQLDEGGPVPLSYTTAATMMGGVLSDKRTVFVAYYHNLTLSEERPAKLSMDWGIAFLDLNGQPIAVGHTPAEWGPVLAVTSGPNNTLLIAVREPEPRILVVSPHVVERTSP